MGEYDEGRSGRRPRIPIPVIRKRDVSPPKVEEDRSIENDDTLPTELLAFRMAVQYRPETKSWYGSLQDVTQEMKDVLLKQYTHLLRPEEVEYLEKIA
ncbi:MAG: hypothetical protein COU33_02780 [Candidatus Magasanikbacteria bacterium CG10_big_fil_rev_8_21_14_0_10_43_6]|uniref:Uncharacterized protein n=1 Tax=Candidatus Magasanikbacteria bacterium CG10_big_fil_rev_8_21_14_0_10_43_6 TaxID=1974650 RepID=A0A2M6W128_9BACT|nr:MAG: hypothetical protein COU33_02780 [Candidatus Magasanikbacteria bacterium CG10_big_fil_rev_8_21_14_0_10_43_6]